MEFFKLCHPHPLVLNEYYHGNEREVCYLCMEHLLPSPVAQSVYHCTQRTKREPKLLPSPIASLHRRRNFDVDCDKMLVHKSCAELPLVLTNYFMHPYHPLTGCTSDRGFYKDECTICLKCFRGRLFYMCRPCDLMVCLRCVTTPLVYHPSHNQHPLVVQRSATFRCHACGQETGDLASCKCTVCPFWIHKSCATLPSSFQSKFHKHPLLLAYYLPQQYIKFGTKCKICKEVIKPTVWLYYCAGCRIFVHIMCASATAMIRSLGEFGDLVHLPARDESSLNMLRQSLIHHMMLNQGVDCDALTWNFLPIQQLQQQK